MSYVKTGSQFILKQKFMKGPRFPKMAMHCHCVSFVGVRAIFFEIDFQFFLFPLVCSRFSGSSGSCLLSWNLRISPWYPNISLVLTFIVSAVAGKVQIVRSPGVRKSSFFQIFRGILMSPRIDSYSMHPPSSGGIQF